MTPGRGALLVGACAGLACSSNPIRGGYVTPDTRPVQGTTIAAFVPGHCEDALHADRPPRLGSVEIVETANGRTLLLEHRQGYDLLVAENHFDHGSEWVFQVVVKAENLVREWHIPRSHGATGTLVIGREIAEAAHAERFEAKLASTYVSCSLVPETSDLPGGSTNPVP